MVELRHLQKEPDLKKAWSHEALEFTPWLAKDENLKALSEAVGISLELTETESDVGDFRADIVCTMENSNDVVVIENQLEPTNHDHLGKIITYAAGKEAKAIIWIVSKARDEHAKAIQWLNNHTDIDFYLVEIELWIISETVFAPHYNVIERPLEGVKTSPRELIDIERNLFSFWERFNEIAPTVPSFVEGGFKLRSAWSRRWYSLTVGRRGIGVDLSVATKRKTLSAGIYISNNTDLYEEFVRRKDEVESILGTQNVTWSDSGKKDRTIRVYTSFDIENETGWNKAISWLCDNASKMKQVIEQIQD